MDLMNSIGKILKNPDTLEQLSSKLGAKPEQVQKGAGLALPTLLEGLQRKASTPEGAASLNRLLDQHQNVDPDTADSYVTQADPEDGQNILNQLFGSHTDKIQTKVASKSGLDPSQASGLLARLAPTILGLLSRAKQETGASAEQGGLMSLLGAAGPQLQQLLKGPFAKSVGRIMDRGDAAIEEDEDLEDMDEEGGESEGLIEKLFGLFSNDDTPDNRNLT